MDTISSIFLLWKNDRTIKIAQKYYFYITKLV